MFSKNERRLSAKQSPATRILIRAHPFYGDIAPAKTDAGGVKIDVVGDIGIAVILNEYGPDDVVAGIRGHDIKVGGGIGE